MEPVYFTSPIEFRHWLRDNHNMKNELIVGYYKVKTGKPSITWSQSVDEALSYGWIDGIRRSINEESYCIRFTPRNPRSIWSAVNIKKAEELIKNGLMQPEGFRLFQNRKVDRSIIYSYENKPEKLPPKFEEIFTREVEAWNFFMKQPPSYKKTILYWILNAKTENTQLNRLHKVINSSSLGKRLFL